MWINSALFVVGMLLCQQLSRLPTQPFGFLLLLAGMMMALGVLLACHPARAVLQRWRKPLFAIAWGLFGFAWAAWHAQQQLAQRLDPLLISEDLLVSGQIVGLPRRHGENWRFEFAPQQASLDGRPVDLPGRLLLSWYRADRQLQTGQQAQLYLRLKPPFGRLNPGLFDYEYWLFQRRIGARGYVVDHPQNRLEKASFMPFSADAWRALVQQRVNRQTDHHQGRAMLLALTIGDRSLLDDRAWEAFRALGINHLVAISGLHIGIIAMLAYWLSGRLWRISATACLWLPAPVVQSAAALFAAALYAALAGFSLPTQRALLMLSVVLGSRLLLINLQPYRQLAMALVAVLLMDPPAVVSPGFWLSFMAVAAIFAVLVREQPAGDTIDWRQRLRSLVAMQWHISLLLVPFSLWFFQQFSLVSPLVNLMLIPLFSFLVVPLALVTVMLLLFNNAMAAYLSASLLAWLDQLMDWLLVLADSDWQLLASSVLPWPVFAMLFVPFLLSLSRLPGRHVLALASLVVLLAMPLPDEQDDRLQVSLLDVGQGTAVVLRRAGNVMLYDLGPRFMGGHSATASVVVPYLESLGIEHIDTLVISHSDSDHAGNVSAVVNRFNTTRVLAGEPEDGLENVTACRAGQQWYWDDTHFEVLHPDKAGYRDNNASCVIRVTHGHIRLLLTGDIEKGIERRLVEQAKGRLRSEVVLVPHHGSASSSTQAFINAVEADYVLNSSGYLNRYDFPRAEVRQRWLNSGALFLDTARLGAFSLSWHRHDRQLQVDSFMQSQRRYWHWPRE